MSTEHGGTNPLGQTSTYKTQYDAGLLFAIARAEARHALALEGQRLPFYGVDIWTGFELSWLNPNGLPQVAVLELSLPCDSVNIVESKSLKLYLNTFNQTVFADSAQVQQTIAHDLQNITGAPVEVTVSPLPTGRPAVTDFSQPPFKARSLDNQDVKITCYRPQPHYLQAADGPPVQRSWVSRLLKTNCPVTGQPDWASVWIAYKGAEIDPLGLLKYIVSFREHQDFHEHCVERMFCDIQARCAPQQLSVYARYTRRGGLDINPFRSTENSLPVPVRLLRQ